MTEELKPCPFCGDTMFLSVSKSCISAKHHFWNVECGCHVYGSPEDTEAEAITAWNKRAPDPKTQRLADALGRADRALMNVGMAADAQARKEIAAALAEWKAVTGTETGTESGHVNF